MKQSFTPSLRRIFINHLAWVALCLLLFAGSRVNAQQASLPCNATVSTAFDNGTNGPFTGLTQSNDNSGIAGWSNPGRVVDGTAGNFATGSITGTGSLTISVKDPAHTYNIGNFAGFLVQPSSIVAAATLTIRTRLAGAEQDIRSVPVFLLSLSAPYEAGLIATKPFDEIELVYALVGVTGSINVFNAVQRGYCTAGPALACNTSTTPTGTAYPMIVDPANTGFSGISVATITNQDNAISASTTDFASVNLLVSAGSASFAIKDQLTDYPIGTFAGLDIASPNLLNVAALGGLTISTYLNGTATGQSVSGTSLVSAGSAILSGTGRRTLGFISTTAFDEVKLTITGVNAVGVTTIYGAVFEKFCAGPTLDCADNTIPKNTLTPLTNPTHPVYVDGANTGVDALVCAGCSVNNSGNVIDSDVSNFATVVLTAGVATNASFAVANALDTYPVNSFAGFDIETNSLLSAAVLSTATITLFNNGSAVQTSTSNGLIVGAGSSPLLNGRSRQYVGVIAKVAYDEVKITFNQLVSANLGTINVYNAIFEKTCANVLACNTIYSLSNPAFPVVIDNANTGVTGVVSAATTVENPWNVVSSSTSDFAKINTTASVGTVASIAVLDAINTYPAGTSAGFTVKKVSGILALDLFSQLTVSTYKSGTLVESRSAGSLLDLSITLFGATTDFFNVGFVTTQPFDEIKLSVSPLVGISALSALGGSLDVYGAFADTRTASGGGLICALNTNPDFAVTNKNVPATGSVKTNDNVPAGTTYGPAPSPTSQPGGSSPSLTVNSDGTYTFVSSTPGVYVYSVPVCGSGLSGTGCATQTLTVTVLDPTVNTNLPVANPDIAVTTGAPSSPTAVTINVRANDGPGNPGGTLGTPTIATAPANGTATVNGSGNVVYTPAAGFYGTDKFTYTVCETPGTSLCASTTVTITVKAPGSANTTTAADDYISTYQGAAITGNVKTNDSDPEGNTQTITAQTTTIPGKGTLVLATDGTYTFTPVAGATGPVDFSYTTTDNGSPVATANGTLHVLINPFNPNPDFAVTTKSVPVTGSVKTNDTVPVGSTYGPAPAPASQPGGSSPSLTVNPDGTFSFSATTPGVYVYNVPVCAVGTPPVCTTQTLTITVLDPAVTTNPPVANPDFVTTTGAPSSPTAVTINIKANDGPGNTGGTLGNPTIVTGPTNGSATIDGSGNLVYTPTAGYYGTDLVTYQVCETPGTSLCASTTVTITVKAPGAPATVSINDDYVATTGGTPANGNVLTNDLGNTLTVSSPATTVTSSGTLVLTSTGSYTFTAAPGFTGPVNFTYTACDNSTPSICGSATLHVLVKQGFPDLTPLINLPSNNFTTSGPDLVKNFTVGLYELAGQQTSSGNIVFTITAPFGYSLAFNSSLTSINVSGGSTVAVNNTNWAVTSDNGLLLTLTIKPGQFIPASPGSSLIGFTITRTVANSNGTANITVNISDDASKTYDSNPVNNIYTRNINAL